MLRFFISGLRNFQEYPDPFSHRLNWEFYIVFDGTCGPQFRDSPVEYRTKSLWLLQRQTEYRWLGKNGSCDRTAFHFSHVPEIVRSRVGDNKYLVKSLSDEEVVRVRALIGSLEPEYRDPDDLFYLHGNRALVELSLLLLADDSSNNAKRLDRVERGRIYEAEVWFKEHLRLRPTIEQVSAHVGVSSSQLRRHFKKFYRRSTHQVLKKIQMMEATRLLSETDLTIDQIASKAGFSSSADFFRNFKLSYMTTPHQWRKEIVKNPSRHDYIQSSDSTLSGQCRASSL